MTSGEQIELVRRDLQAGFGVERFSEIRHDSPLQTLFDSRDVLTEGYELDDEWPASTAVGKLTMHAAQVDVPIIYGRPEICSQAEARFLLTLSHLLEGRAPERKEHYIIVDPEKGPVAIQKGEGADSTLALQTTPEFPTMPGGIYFGDLLGDDMLAAGENIAPRIFVVGIDKVNFEFGRFSTFSVPSTDSQAGDYIPLTTFRERQTRVDHFKKAAQDLIDAA